MSYTTNKKRGELSQEEEVGGEKEQ